MAREIELQASLQHPSIVQIYAAFEDEEGIYVVQEFALGGDLYAQLAQAGGYLAEDQVAGEVMVPVLAALGHMHDKVSHVLKRITTNRFPAHDVLDTCNTSLIRISHVSSISSACISPVHSAPHCRRGDIANIFCQYLLPISFAHKLQLESLTA